MGKMVSPIMGMFRRFSGGGNEGADGEKEKSEEDRL